MDTLRKSVDQTNRYAAFFKSRLSDEELHRWLISDRIYSAKTLKALFPQKTKSRLNSSPKLLLAQKAARLICFVPTISLIAITGSLAVNNAKPDDDIDLMIVTTPNTLWLTRLLVVPLISLFFKRRTPKHQISNLKSEISNTICLNLWLDETTLAVPPSKINLYTAHEVLQALPIFDWGDCYNRFILANSWTKKFLANAYLAASCQTSAISQRKKNNFLLSTIRCLLPALNFLAFKLQYLYMKKKITNETISLHAAYFHPRNLSHDLETFLGV